MRRLKGHLQRSDKLLFNDRFRYLESKTEIRFRKFVVVLEIWSFKGLIFPSADARFFAFSDAVLSEGGICDVI